MAKYSVSYVYEIVDKYSKNLDKITKATHKYTRAKRKSLIAIEKFKRGLKSMIAEALKSKLGLAALGAGAVVFAKSSISAFLTYEKSMNKVSATTMANAVEMKKLSNLAKELGRTTQYSAAEAADAMTFLAMAGLNTNQIMKALPNTLMLASAGSLSLADAADISTNILSGMGLGVEELARVNDVMAKTASSANTNVLEMSGAMREAASSAVLTGVGLEEVSSLVGKLADAGIKGSRAGTGLKNMFIKIPMASEKIKNTLKSAGVSLDDFVDKGKFTDFTGFIESLSKANVGAETFKDLVGLEAINSLSSLVNAERKASGSIKNLTNKLNKAGGAAKEMAERNMAGLTGVVAEFRSSFEGLQIAMMDGTLFGGFVSGIVKAGTAVTKFLTPNGELSKSFGDLLRVIGHLLKPFSEIFAFLFKISVVEAFKGAIFILTLSLKGLATSLRVVSGFLNTIWNVLKSISSLNLSNLSKVIKAGASNTLNDIKGIWGKNNPAAESASNNSLNGNINVTANNATVDKAEFKNNGTPIPTNIGGK